VTWRGAPPRIHWFAVHGQDREDAFVDAPQGLAPDEALECLDAERQLRQGERALVPTFRAQAVEIGCTSVGQPPRHGRVPEVVPVDVNVPLREALTLA
jgi:hypothetical protein